MGTADSYQRHDPRRVCDICGVVWHKSDLTRIGPLRWACPDDKDGLTAEQIARHNANVRPLTIRPVKNAKGPSQTPTYQQAEGVILNLVLANAPNSIFLAENGLGGAAMDSVNQLADKARAAGWQTLYLANLVNENRRPRAWIEQARAKMLTLADSIVAAQILNTLAVPTSAAPEYGGIYLPATTGTIVIDVPGNAACLLALLGVYRATGAVKYIVAARNIATFLRRAQCVGLYSSFNAQYTATQPVLPGPFPESVKIDQFLSANVTVVFYKFSISGLVCAWALHALQVADGNASYGTGAQGFVSEVGSLLSDAVAACVSWWATGARNTGGAIVVGFSSTTPKNGYSSGAAGGVTNGSWDTLQAPDGSKGVQGIEYALGVRSLWEVGGYTAQVATLYEWLRSFTSDPANHVPATWDHLHAQKSTLGTYDPTLALAWQLRVLDPTGAPTATESTDSLGGSVYNVPGYDWRTVGILAPIQSAKSAGDLAAAKDQMSAAARRRWSARLMGAGAPSSTTLSSAAYDRVDIQDDLRLLGFSGLSFQTSAGMLRLGWQGLALGHYVDLVGAVQAADAYRYAPGAFPLEQG